MIKLKYKMNVGDFLQLTNLLKNKSKSYMPKKSKIFTYNEVKQFVDTAQEKKYLSIKVVLILDIYGVCRDGELINLKAKDVTVYDDFIKVTLKDTKSSNTRAFVVDEEWMMIVKKYIDIRSRILKSNKCFFLRYHEGKCFNQPIGKNTITEFLGKIARFLNLENPEIYTGHSFRRLSATLAADSGMSMIDSKRLAGWKSSSVTEGYIEESLQDKKINSKQISNIIVGTNENVLSGPPEKRGKYDVASAPLTSQDNIQNIYSVISNQTDKIFLNISGCTNVYVNFK